MMTKGTFFLNETLRKGAPMVTDVSKGCFMARARLPFPQGLQFLYKVFQGRPLADVYSHGYFIEKQSNPDQPSPQFHLTEEMQGIMRVMKGLLYMSDVSCRLDNAMTLVKDPSFEASTSAASTSASNPNGKWIMYNPIELDDKTLPALRHRLTGSNAYLSAKVGVDEEIKSEAARRAAEELRASVADLVSTIVIPSQQTYGNIAFWMEEFPNAKIIASGPSIPPRVAEELFRGKTVEQKAAILSRFTFVAPSQVITPIPIVATPVQTNANGDRLDTPHFNTSNAMSAARLGGALDASSVVAGPLSLNRGLTEEESSAAESFKDPSTLIDPADGAIDLPFAAALLRRVPGDALTNELVMLHRPSNSVSCTDLFHGGYADYDPLNTWMCRAWFKFNRNGDYKDARVLPLFRRRQIEAQNGGSVEKGGKGIAPVAEFVHNLVANRDSAIDAGFFNVVQGTKNDRGFDTICHAHGTPPTRDHARELMLAQYDLFSMPKMDQPSIDVTSTNIFSTGRV